MPKFDWKPFFPYERIRPGQEEAIDSILNAFELGKKYFILEAGTGIGKSAVAATVAKYIEKYFIQEENTALGSNILTTQKLLQDQYRRDYTYINSLKSSSNYQCTFHKTQSCNESRKMLQTTDRSEPFFKRCAFKCIYKQAKDKYINEPHGVTNFSYFLAETRYSGKIPKKTLLVIDEAHNAPEELSKFIEVTFSDRFAKSFVGITLPEKITPGMFVRWVKDEYHPKLVQKVSNFNKGLEKFASIKSRMKGGEFSKLSRQIEILTGHEQKVLTFIALYDKDNWVMTEIPAEEKSSRKVEFKPIDISPYAEDYMFKMGQYVLLMSATIVDIDKFSKMSGVEKYESLRLPCPFPLENRPILYSGIGKMSANEINSTLPRLTTAVKEILKEHKNEKGIIHCHSYKIAWHLKKNIRNSRLLIHDSTNRDEILRKHTKSREPTVILSPSMTEGVDLKEDLSRFQVICKVPFPYLGDKLVRKKMNKWSWWYDLQTAKTVIQAAGRSVRSETDTAVTYILDASWERFYGKNKKLFGPEFG
jgi:ATP-dependent DNA helicase DinG|tara:strand:+ start:6262 stop:7860 length:1599 start_codon:yes stop_codon:yes gene_type:complete